MWFHVKLPETTIPLDLQYICGGCHKIHKLDMTISPDEVKFRDEELHATFGASSLILEQDSSGDS